MHQGMNEESEMLIRVHECNEELRDEWSDAAYYATRGNIDAYLFAMYGGMF